MSNQTGFINLFILLPLLVIATVAATLGISKVLDKNDKGVELANISEQIEQKENELEIAASSNSQETVSQELLKLKIELEKLKQPQATKAPVQKTQPPIITNTPVITQSSNQNLRIELSASRYSLPANGEAISFITAEIRDQNNKLAETFSGEVIFNATAGVLIPNKVTLRNGSAYTELQASTVPTNLTITAQSGEIKSNFINLSFSSINTNDNIFQQTQLQEISIDAVDIKAVPQLHCPDGKLEHIGSGVIFTQNGYLLTNNHVAGNSIDCEVWIAFDDKQPPRHVYTAFVLDSNSNLDVSVLKINRDAYGNILENRNFNFLKIYNDNISLGQSIRAMGYPSVGGSTITITKGIAGGWDGNFVKTDLLVNRGNSGGPVINDGKEVIGIVSHRIADTDDILFYFVDINKIVSWWKSKYGIWLN